MNKKLLALAVAGAFVAPVAMADNSNVTIYGNAAVSIDSVNGNSSAAGFDGATTTGTTDRERRMRVTSNNSYLGFKGSEDLGNGLSAIWQLESSIDFTRQNQNDVSSSDNVYKSGHAGVISGRNSFVGMSSKSWGSVTLGLQDTPLKTSTGKLDQFKDTLADYRSLFTTNTASVRAQNSVMYTSPSINGFTAKGLVGAQNEAGNGTTGAPHLYSLSATYDNGPIFAVAAFEDNKQYYSATNTDSKVKTTRLGAGYNFGSFKLGLGWEKQKLNGETSGTAYDATRKAWNLSGAYSMTKADTLKVQYTKVSDCTANGTLGVAPSQGQAAGGTFCSVTGSGSGAKQWAMGVDHAMSKRTKVYALYTAVKNDTNAKYALGGGATGVPAVLSSEAGKKVDGWSIGMTHSF